MGKTGVLKWKEAIMKLNERLAYIQTRMEQELENGTCSASTAMYESSLVEITRISRWIERQCQINNRIHFEEEDGEIRRYFRFCNDTGIDFKLVSMKVNVIDGEEIIDTFEMAAANWKNGKTARLYIDEEVKDGCMVSIDAGSVDYMVL